MAVGSKRKASRPAPETAPDTAAKKGQRPYTGKEFLASLDDDREVWIYGERVKNITTHPAFQNTARMLARLYDALHEDHRSGKHVLTMPTEWGGFTHRYFRAPTNVDEQVAGRDAIAAWARLTYGWLGRSPDYKAAFLGTLGANAEFYAPYQANAKRWYRFSQERVPFINHAIIQPPVADSYTQLRAHETRRHRV
jgi:4-hydroxyphenylacetate 3-monooxygenase